MSLLIMTMVHDFSGEGYSDVYKLSPDKSNVNAVINNNIDNYQKFNPGCNIVMHVNAEYKDFQWEDRPGVYVSPKRFVVKHGECQLASILTMFRHAVDAGIDFDCVTINHSGEMYVKPGAYDYMKKYDYGVWHGPESKLKNNHLHQWPPGESFISNAKQGWDPFEGLFDPLAAADYCVSQLEGSFYKRDLFQKIYDWFDENYEIESLNEWPLYYEEIMIPTLAYHLSGKSTNYTHPICAFYIERGHGTLDTTQYVDNVVNNQPVIAWGSDNLPYWGTRLPRAPRVDGSKLYTVKRVNRIINDPIRQYITQITC